MPRTRPLKVIEKARNVTSLSRYSAKLTKTEIIICIFHQIAKKCSNSWCGTTPMSKRLTTLAKQFYFLLHAMVVNRQAEKHFFNYLVVLNNFIPLKFACPLWICVTDKHDTPISKSLYKPNQLDSINNKLIIRIDLPNLHWIKKSPMFSKWRKNIGRCGSKKIAVFILINFRSHHFKLRIRILQVMTKKDVSF